MAPFFFLCALPITPYWLWLKILPPPRLILPKKKWCYDRLNAKPSNFPIMLNSHATNDPAAHECLPKHSLHLDEELELERLEERKLRLPREEWGLDCLQYALRNVSNEKWFRGGGGMIDLKIAGPHRQSTFRRVFSNVPGAVYGCLKVCGREGWGGGLGRFPGLMVYQDGGLQKFPVLAGYSRDGW